jgi:hypothetical protein
VLLLGGATSTLIAGQIALARQLPILAVNRFGGAAAKIWAQLVQGAPQDPHPAWGTRPAAELVGRLKEACLQQEADRRAELRREQVVTAMGTQRNAMVYAASAFLCLIAALVAGMTRAPPVQAFPFITFAGLITAGATGALARLLMAEGAEKQPRMSLILGGIAGLLVGLAYLIPQWIGAHGMLEPDAAAVSATDKIQFASAALVAVSAGAGFDTVFNRLQKQAQNVAIGVVRT